MMCWFQLSHLATAGASRVCEKLGLCNPYIAIFPWKSEVRNFLSRMAVFNSHRSHSMQLPEKLNYSFLFSKSFRIFMSWVSPVQTFFFQCQQSSYIKFLFAQKTLLFLLPFSPKFSNSPSSFMRQRLRQKLTLSLRYDSIICIMLFSGLFSSALLVCPCYSLPF